MADHLPALHGKTPPVSHSQAILSQQSHNGFRIEETWRQWEKFHADYQRFGDFLAEMDKLLVSPKTDSATFAQLKAELRKFEVLVQ
jgi:hypothetical protein